MQPKIQRELAIYWTVSFEEINQKIHETIEEKTYLTHADFHLEIKEEYGTSSIRLYYEDRETRVECMRRRDKEDRAKAERERQERRQYEELKRKFEE